MRKIIVFAYMVAAFSIPTFGQLQKDYIDVEGTAVRMKPPVDYVKAERFTGFINEKVQASIMVVEIDAPFDEIASGFNLKDLALKGITLVSKNPTQVDGHTGFMMTLGQRQSGINYEKKVLALKNGGKVLLITATYPKTKGLIASKDLVSSLMLIKWFHEDAPAPPKPTANFSILETEKLKISRVISKMFLLTLNGDQTAQTVDRPLVVVAQSFSAINITDRKGFAEQRTLKYNTMSDVRITETKPITIDGLDGFETFFSAKDNSSGKELFNYQVMLFGQSDYYLITGIISSENKDLYVEDFKKIAQSFRLVKK